MEVSCVKVSIQNVFSVVVFVCKPHISNSKNKKLVFYMFALHNKLIYRLLTMTQNNKNEMS